MLCPVSMPVTTLGLCFVEGQKSGLCSQTSAPNQFLSMCLGADKTPPHCHMLVVYPAFYLSSYILTRDPPGSVQVQHTFEQYCLLWACWNLISLYRKQPLLCQMEMSFNAFWHCHINGDVLAAWRAFRATWLRANTNIFLWPSICLNFQSTGQDSIYLGLETVANFPREKLSLHPQDSSPGSCILDPSVYQTSPLTAGVPGPLVHSSLVSKVTLYLG